MMKIRVGITTQKARLRAWRVPRNCSATESAETLKKASRAITAWRPECAGQRFGMGMREIVGHDLHEIGKRMKEICLYCRERCSSMKRYYCAVSELGSICIVV